MPRIELTVSVGDGEKTAVAHRLHGPGTLPEVVELLAVAVHAAMTMAESVDRDANAEGKFLSAVRERIENLNVDPEYSGVLNCRIEKRDA